jgi:hypothetical protein
MRPYLISLGWLVVSAATALASPIMHHYRLETVDSGSRMMGESALALDIFFPDPFVRSGGGTIAGSGSDDLQDLMLPAPRVQGQSVYPGPMVEFSVTAGFAGSDLTFLSFRTAYGDDYDRAVAEGYYDPAFAGDGYDGFVRYYEGLCGPALPECGPDPSDPWLSRLEFLGVGQALAEVPEPPVLPILAAAGLAVWGTRRLRRRP